MRVAGVRLADGRGVWVNAGDHSVRPLDTATVRIGDRQEEGMVFAAPEHIVRPPSEVVGEILAVRRREEVEPECGDLPGASMPPLGSWVQVSGGRVQVVAIDAVRRMVTVRHEDGTEQEVASEDLEGGHG